jgi:hypothetical protein
MTIRRGKIAKYMFGVLIRCGNSKGAAEKRAESMKILKWYPDFALTSKEKEVCNYTLGNCIELVLWELLS